MAPLVPLHGPGFLRAQECMPLALTKGRRETCMAPLVLPPRPWIPACAGMTEEACMVPLVPPHGPGFLRAQECMPLALTRGRREACMAPLVLPPRPWIPACAGMTEEACMVPLVPSHGPGFLHPQECMPLAPRATRGRREVCMVPLVPPHSLGFLHPQECMPLAPRATRGRREARMVPLGHVTDPLNPASRECQPVFPASSAFSQRPRVSQLHRNRHIPHTPETTSAEGRRSRTPESRRPRPNT